MQQEAHTSALFFRFTPGESERDFVERLVSVKEMGIHQIIASYEEKDLKETHLGENYFQTLPKLASACEKLQMRFWLEDYAPFPTGSANGAYKKPEHARLNKLYIDERHLDIRGPLRDAVFRMDLLQNVTYGQARTLFAKLDPSGRKRIGAVAWKMKEDPRGMFHPVLEDHSAVCLNSRIKDGRLHWSVPEGYWRIFVLFTTYEGAGRPDYMNLLSKESVRLEIEQIHRPIYEALKGYLGRSWNGFFYDEPEIGNAGNADVFDCFMLPGRRTHQTTDCNVYPWSPEMATEMEKRDPDWILHLPLLWYDGAKEHRKLRLSYMDAVTSLVRENYNGQVYDFCQTRGIAYMGHVLEDEGSHARLGCGPGHYFRQQYYQDEAGIDVIAGQILPGRDGSASWYGAANADGEFYHYGLAKLASSEGRINPWKKNRSMCETFAMYGRQGYAEKKFLIDHLLVNGVNRILFGDLSANAAPVEYARVLGEYTDRMCALLRGSTPVIKTAVLYHAEAEWAGDALQGFQTPAAQLARNQISYDVIPADVFAFPERYETDVSDGLTIHKNRYEALIVPGCRCLPEAVCGFLKQCAKTGFPVIFTEIFPRNLPPGIKQHSVLHCVKTECLAEEIQSMISLDVKIEAKRKKEWIRFSHLRKDKKDYYLLHNESPDDGETVCSVSLKTEADIICRDPVSGIFFLPRQEYRKNGWKKVKLSLGRYQLCILEPLFAKEEAVRYRPCESMRQSSAWTVEFADGNQICGKGEALPVLEETTGEEFYGKIIYRSSYDADTNLPSLLDLGYVSDCCEVRLNGQTLGKRIASPFLYDVRNVVREGENKLEIEVYTSADNLRLPIEVFKIPLDSLTAAPYSLVAPLGMCGPLCWKEERKDESDSMEK